MYLDEIMAAQKKGEARGITSVCSAHRYVIQQTLKRFEFPLLEATCNQVNQFGGYTGMTPSDFVGYVRGIADENDTSFEKITFGGDHLGPHVWQTETAASAIGKSKELIRAYVRAGFIKLHLDCSMRLADDPPGALAPDVIADRAAQLAKVAEAYGGDSLRYVIGTEVPIPGGAIDLEAVLHVTRVEDAQQAVEATRAAFRRAGLESAWERVIAVVVQPGVEFGDDNVLDYDPERASALTGFIEREPHLVYEAHSTDYQTREALSKLVYDHFAVLKVGPRLTFALREAVFALAFMESELFTGARAGERSNILEALDSAMLRAPEHWRRHYRGSPAAKEFARKFSLSDRIRYYWQDAQVQAAFHTLMENLSRKPLPLSLLSQFAPLEYVPVRDGVLSNTPHAIILNRVGAALDDYAFACSGDQFPDHD